MMAYDLDKDKCIAEVGEFESKQGSVVRVGIWSYAGGTPKVGLTRGHISRSGRERIGPIGRLTKEELERVLPLLQSALEQL